MYFFTFYMKIIIPSSNFWNNKQRKITTSLPSTRGVVTRMLSTQTWQRRRVHLIIDFLKEQIKSVSS